MGSFTYLSLVLCVIYKFYDVKSSISLWPNAAFLVTVKLLELIIILVHGTFICSF